MTAASERASDPHAAAALGSVRSIVFLVAAIAARYDQNLGEFRDRLLKAGGEKMVVRIALARKLLVILNAKARDARAQYANAT
jgi:transposase